MSRMPVRNLFYVLLVVLAWIARCAGPFRTAGPLFETSPETLLNQIHDHASQLTTFQGFARFTIASPEGSFGGTVRVILKTPDSLWMKIEGPLGVDLAVIRFGGDSALVYSPWENMVYQGSLSHISEMNLLPSGFLGPSKWILGVTGLLVPDHSALDSLAEFTSKNKQYLFVERNGEQYWIEPEGPVVTRWEKCDSTGHPIQKWEGKSFKTKRGIRFPERIHYATLCPEQRISLQYEKVRMNKPLRKGWFGIRIPEGAQKVEIGFETSFE